MLTERDHGVKMKGLGLGANVLEKKSQKCYINSLDLDGRLAQLGERGVRNAEVVGSSPIPSTPPFFLKA